MAELVASMPRDSKGVPVGRSRDARRLRLPDDKKQLDRHIRWVYRAAEPFGVSGEKEVTPAKDAPGYVDLWFWTAPKVTRPRRK